MTNILNLTKQDFELLDTLPDAIRIIDRKGSIVYYNDNKLKDYPVLSRECSPDEPVISEDFDVTNVADTRDAIDKIIQRQEIIGGKSYTVRCSPIYDEQNRVAGIVEVFRDVTRKRELENAVRRESINLEADLDFAKIIQTKLLPLKGSFKRITLDYIYRPSRQLSGDLFDVYNIDDNHIGMYMVDVAGHGIAASMMTVFIRQVMQTIFDKLLSPQQTLQEMQKKFQELGLDANRYFTMFVGVYSVEDRVFTYANAGHNCLPYLINEKKGSYTQLISYGLPILSFDLGEAYEEKSVKLEPGDELLFFTDGLIEGRNKEGELYTEDRLKHAIINSENGLLEDIIDDYDYFSGGLQEDDIALLLLCIK